MPQNETKSLKERVVRALRGVRDPEIPVNIYDLGLIYDLKISEEGVVSIRMTLTSPNCPVAEMLPAQVERAVRGVEDVADVNVELVWEPAWTRDRMSEAAKLELGMNDIPQHKPGNFVSVDALRRRP